MHTKELGWVLTARVSRRFPAHVLPQVLSDVVFLLPDSSRKTLCRHSGPQGHVKPLTIIDDPSDWTSASLQGRESEYTYQITEADVKEIVQVLQLVQIQVCI